MGLGHPRQTAYLKSLGRAGIPVRAVHTEQKAHRFSRHLTGFHRIGTQPEQQLDRLEQLGRDVGGMLIPTNDDYVALVAQNRERLSKYFIVPLPDWDIVGPLVDRVKAYALAESVGIKVPRRWCPDTDSALQTTIAALEPDRCDYILKTRTVLSEPTDETNRQTKAASKDRSGILKACEDIRLRTGQYPLIQEVVPGESDSAIGVSMVVSPQGDTVLAYCVRRLRLATYKIDGGYVHPYELGSVVWCETAHDTEALDAARELVKRSGYRGLITVEFRRDARDGSLYLMKIEPRPVRATSLSSAIGMDIPTAVHAVFTGQSTRVATDYPDGIGWLWIQAYAHSLIWNAHHNRRDMLRVVRMSGRLRTFGEDLSDPLPYIVGAACLAARPGIRILQGLLPVKTLRAMYR